MKNLSILPILFLIPIVFTACNKDKNNTERLTNGYWEVKQLDFEPNSVSQFYIDNFRTSLIGDQIKFNVGGDFTTDGGSFYDLYTTGDWTFSPNEEKIILDGYVDWEIVELSGKHLIINTFFGNYGSQGDLNGTITFTH